MWDNSSCPLVVKHLHNFLSESIHFLKLTRGFCCNLLLTQDFLSNILSLMRCDTAPFSLRDHSIQMYYFGVPSLLGLPPYRVNIPILPFAFTRMAKN